MKKDDIKQIEERLKALKTPNSKPKSEVSKFSNLGFRIMTELLSGVVIGAGVGYFLDDLFGSKPWLLIVFLLLGGAAGILNVYRFAKRQGEKRV